MPNKRQAKAGFAIVEVLVATVVLAIGFLELARAFRNINSVANQAVAMTKASNLANATMERVMAKDFDSKGNEAGGYALDSMVVMIGWILVRYMMIYRRYLFGFRQMQWMVRVT